MSALWGLKKSTWRATDDHIYWGRTQRERHSLESCLSRWRQSVPPGRKQGGSRPYPGGSGSTPENRGADMIDRVALPAPDVNNTHVTGPYQIRPSNTGLIRYDHLTYSFLVPDLPPCKYSTENTIHWNIVVFSLAHCLRSWSSIKTTLFQCIVFAEKQPCISKEK